MQKKAIYPLLFIILMISSINSFNLFENNQNYESYSQNYLKSYLKVDHSNNKIILSSSPIQIIDNDDFATQAAANGWIGDGSINNPYIIEELNITPSSGSINAFGIWNTNVSFILQHNILAAGGWGTGGCAVSFYNVENGIIRNNIVENSDCSFKLVSSSNITLSDNTANNNVGFGFHLKSSSNITLSDNTANNNFGFGFHLKSSSNITLINNTANNNSHSGFYLEATSNNTFIHNTANNNTNFGFNFPQSYGFNFPQSNNVLINNTASSNLGGFIFFESSHNIISNNVASANLYFGFSLNDGKNNTLSNNRVENGTQGSIIISGSKDNSILNNSMDQGGISLNCRCYQTNVSGNSINGLPLIFLQHARNQTISEKAGQIILINTTLTTIRNQVITHTAKAINLISSNNNTLYNNTASFNTNNGFYLHSSSYNTLYNNTANFNNNVAVYSNHNNGFYLHSSSYNTLYNNTANFNGNGVELHGNHNNITNNRFSFNTQDGIWLEGSYTSSNNIINMNYIDNNFRYGIIISSGFSNNNITNNTFINNNNELIQQNNYAQARDMGYDNRFEFNFWSDHLSPDVDGDGIIDIPYLIRRISNSIQYEDPYPSALPHHDIPPLITVQSPTSSIYDSNAVQLMYSIFEPGITTIFIDNTPNATVLVNGTEINDLQDGFHNITILSIDEAGNIGKKEILFTIESGAIGTKIGTYTITLILDGSDYSGTVTISKKMLFGSYTNNFGTFTNITKILYSDMKLTRNTGSLSIQDNYILQDGDYNSAVYSFSNYSLRDSRYLDADFTIEEEYSIANVTENDTVLIEEYHGRQRENNRAWVDHQYKDVTTFESEDLRNLTLPQFGISEVYTIRISLYTDNEYTGYQLIWVTPMGDLIKSEEYDENNNLLSETTATFIYGYTPIPISSSSPTSSTNSVNSTTNSTANATGFSIISLMLAISFTLIIGIKRKKKGK